jgi:alkyl hydroperoxide reductase subunit F
MENKNIYDVIIIGAGPGGMTAGIYTTRRAMKTLILGKDIGGQMGKTIIVENHPGIKSGSGIDIAFGMQEQVKSFGAEYEIETVKEIKKENNLFEIKTTSEKIYESKSVILAFGLEKRKLGFPNEKKLEGRGLSYCITCDGPMYKDKNVAIVGGGNAGAEAVEFMAKICPKVYWLEIMEKINADKILQNRIAKLNNVEIMTNTKITEVVGENNLEKIKIQKAPFDDAQGETSLKVSGVFIEIGYVSHSGWLKDLIDLDKIGQIKIDKNCHTNLDGVFAIGDCTDVKYKQIVIAEGMGAVAGLESYEYVNKI